MGRPTHKGQQYLPKIYVSPRFGRPPVVHLLLVAALAVEVVELVAEAEAASTAHQRQTGTARALSD
jgi:hypothetical protein